MKLLIKASILASIIGSISPVQSASPERPPNLIVIMTDDQGYADVGFNGCKDIPTPNLDSIAKNGVHFPNGYVSYSVCSPSRAGFLTGRYEQRFGHERNPKFQPGNPQSGLPLSETTLADALGKVGYQSGIIGKWHLGAHPDLHPLKRWFNEFFGHLGGGHCYFPEELTLQITDQAKSETDSYKLWIMRDQTAVKTTHYLTDEFSDEAVRFVERHKAEPFFLYLAYNAPHSPQQASEKYLARFPDIKNESAAPTPRWSVRWMTVSAGFWASCVNWIWIKTPWLSISLTTEDPPTTARITTRCGEARVAPGKVASACPSPRNGPATSPTG